MIYSNITNMLPTINQQAYRKFKDNLAHALITFGGVSIILVIVLVGLYLTYVVLPIFKPANIELVKSYDVPAGLDHKTMFYDLEEQREIGLRVNDHGEFIFFKTTNGEVIKRSVIAIEATQKIVASADPTQNTIALALSNGQVIVVRYEFKTSYDDDQRIITPNILFPFDEPIQVASPTEEIQHLSIQYNEEVTTIIASILDPEDNIKLKIIAMEKEESLFDEDINITEHSIYLNGTLPTHIKLNIQQNKLYIADTNGYIHYYDVTDKTQAKLVQKIRAVNDGTITTFTLLSSGISLIIGDSNGYINQWLPIVDDDNNRILKKIRSFKMPASVVNISPEYFRKGFIAVDVEGNFSIYHSTAEKRLLMLNMPELPIHISQSPRANAMLSEYQNGQLSFWHIDNEHPEISIKSLWQKNWYENRNQAEFIWQSSSASSDFEPKFSLTPLLFGTFKAAFYALLFAIPLAILGAIYTAYFMSQKMRNYVKPTIEIMEALPTVILGFLAGLWLAPLVENHLLGIFLMLIFIPTSIVLASLIWTCLPTIPKSYIKESWEVVWIIPIILISATVAFQLAPWVETLFFDDNLVFWLDNTMGFDYDQRNSLIVGIAMGFAVIPTIFSISEDAIFGVPKHLSYGSLALGATQWQTMSKIVILTASPGIFSAVMMGLGRAVGETMIVVMATGNTPIMDMNIFEGFRALSANIAVEMPESEVGGTHYRILFLSGLVLFSITLFFNTIAELVRQNLRLKYSTL